MSKSHGFSRRGFLRMSALGASALLVACAPKVVKETVVVEKEVEKVVKETVIVAGTPKVVEKVVTKEVEKVVTATPAPPKVVTVEWWVPNFHMSGAGPMKAKIEEAFPNIKLNQNETVWGGLWEKIFTTLQGGSQPDIIDVAVPWSAPLAVAGLVQDVTERNEDWSDWQTAALDTVKYQGKIFGVPFRSEAMALIRNKNLFETVGLDPDKPPVTWDDLLTLALQLNNPPQWYGYGMSGYFYDQPLTYIWSNGGDVLTPDYTQAICNQPACVEAVQFYTDLVTKYKVTPEIAITASDTEADDLFIANKVGMQISGPYIIPRLTTEAPDLKWGASLTPKRKTFAAALGGWNFIIPKGARHLEEAWTAIDFMTKPDNMAELVFPTGNFPSRKSSLQHPLYTQAEYLAPFAEQLQYARAMPPLVQWDNIGKVLVSYIQSIMLGQTGVQEAMDMAAEEIDKLLQEG